MSRSLHWQIFGALLLTGVSCVAVMLVVVSLWGDGRARSEAQARDIAAVIADDLPSARGPELRRVLRRRARSLHASVSMWDAQGRPLGRAGRPLRPPRGAPPTRPSFDARDRSHWFALPDGRSVAVALRPSGPPTPGLRLWAFSLLFAVLLLGSYVAAKRITRRLTELTQGVMRFGQGNLDTRVSVRGADEIAELAGAFNRSFARISGLLRQQRRMLQSASHELRSPLTRVRMAIELLGEGELDAGARAQMVRTAERDIEDLDALIGDLLLAGRLADSELPRDFVEVDLAALVESEAARTGAQTDVRPFRLQGNPRMLRSMVRNLLENARRYGADPVCARLSLADAAAVLRVEDHGPGVAPEDEARIFEPFYRPQGHSEGRDGGVGLGLSLVREVALHHHGSVRYLRARDLSCFEVRLPTALPAPHSPAEVPSSP